MTRPPPHGSVRQRHAQVRGERVESPELVASRELCEEGRGELGVLPRKGTAAAEALVVGRHAAATLNVLREGRGARAFSEHTRPGVKHLLAHQVQGVASQEEAARVATLCPARL